MERSTEKGGVLRDLRAYFQRGKKPCRNERGGHRPGAPLGYLCTLPDGHDGSHVAHDLDGTIITRWRTNPPGQTP